MSMEKMRLLKKTPARGLARSPPLRPNGAHAEVFRAI